MDENYSGLNLIQTLTLGAQHDRAWWMAMDTPELPKATLLYQGYCNSIELDIHVVGDTAQPEAVAVGIECPAGEVVFTSDPKAIPGIIDASLLPGFGQFLEAFSPDVHSDDNEGPPAWGFEGRLEHFVEQAMKP